MSHRLPSFTNLSNISPMNAWGLLDLFKRDLQSELDDDSHITYSAPGRAHYRNLTRRKLGRVVDFADRLGIEL